MLSLEELRVHLIKGAEKLENSYDWSEYRDYEKREIAYTAGFNDAIKLVVAETKAKFGIKD